MDEEALLTVCPTVLSELTLQLVVCVDNIQHTRDIKVGKFVSETGEEVKTCT